MSDALWLTPWGLAEIRRRLDAAGKKPATTVAELIAVMRKNGRIY